MVNLYIRNTLLCIDGNVPIHFVAIPYKKWPEILPWKGHLLSMTKLMKICAFVFAVFGTLSVLLAAITVLVPTPAAAQEVVNGGAPVVCDDRSTIVSSLSNDYKETRNSIGLANTGSVVEVFSATDGSWSLVVTRPDGISCLVAAGKNWESLTQKVGQRI